MWSVKRRVPSVACKVSSVACKVWSVECRVYRVKCRVWSVECRAFFLCLCLSVSMSDSVWEGGYICLREVTGKHGSNFLPFSGPSVGYWISLLGSLGNGRFGPNPSREVTGGHGSEFLPFGGPLAADWISLLGSLGNGRFGPNPGRELTGGHGGHERLREVTGTEGENGGKWRNGRKKILVGDNQRKWRKCQV